MFSESPRRRFAPARPLSRRHRWLRSELLESRLNLSAIGSDDFRISFQGPDGDPNIDADEPAVAYNSTDNEYLVVWAAQQGSFSTSEIYGQRLDAATRRPLGESFQIATVLGRNSAPAVAYNSTWNEYLVVREGFVFQGLVGSREILGERLSATGEEVAEFQISDTAAVVPHTPAVAYNSADNQYLVVWEGQFNFAGPFGHESEIFGQQLGPAGVELGDDFRISHMGPDGSLAYHAHDPAVVYDSADNDYLVVWSADDDSGLLVDDEFEIYGQRINASPESFGEIGASDFRISNIGTSGDPTFDAQHPALAYNSANNEYLVVWDANDGSDAESAFEIFGQRLVGETGLTIGTNDFRISDAGTSGDGDFDATHPAVGYHRATNRYVVVWSGDDNVAPLVEGELEIFGQTLNALPASFGEIEPNDFRISHMGPSGDPAYGANTPALASSDTEFLAVWSGDDNSGDLVNDELEIFGRSVGSTDRPEGFYDPATQALLLYGSNQADAFHLSADVQGNILIMSAGKPVIPIDAASGQAQSPSLANSQSIKGLMRGGEDRFEFPGFVGIATEIFGEDGSDVFSLQLPLVDKAEPPPAPLVARFDGGDGSDTFQLLGTDLAEEISLISELGVFDIPSDALRVRDLASGALLAEVIAANAENVVVDAGKSDDVVVVQAHLFQDAEPPPAPKLARRIHISLGEGNDSLALDYRSAANIGLNLQVDGGQDDDAIEAALTWAGAAVDAFLPISAEFYLGDGQNTLQLDFNSEANVGLDLRVDGGQDDDAIEAALNWAGAFDAFLPISAEFDLGAGHDALQFGFSSDASDTNLKLNVEGDLGSDEVQVFLECPSDSPNGVPTDFLADVAVNLGGDDDVFGFAAVLDGAQTLMNLHLGMGSGEDDVSIADTSIFGQGIFEINTGFDNDLVLFERNTFQALNFHLNTGSGHDFALVEGNSVTGTAKLNFNLDTGNDELNVLDNLFAQGLTFAASGGTGADSIAYESNAAQGAATLNFDLAAGNDLLAIRKSTFKQVTLNVRAGSGGDRVWLEGNTFTGPSGKITIDLGLGRDLYFNRRNKLGKNVTLKVIDPDK